MGLGTGQDTTQTISDSSKASKQTDELDEFYGWLILIIGLLVISVMFNVVFVKRLRQRNGKG